MTELSKFTKVKTIAKKGIHYATKVKSRRRRQLVFSIIGVYLIAGFLLGFFLFYKPKQSPAGANQYANVVSSIRFKEEKKFNLGDQIEVNLTLQNTSIIEPINEIAVEMLSTKESVNWEEATTSNTQDKIIKSSQKNFFRLPVLSSGQRLQYSLKGTLKDANLDSLVILSKIYFSNQEGNQEIETNRIYTDLKGNNSVGAKPIYLGSEKENYKKNEVINLTLAQDKDKSNPLSPTLEGKIFVNNKDSGEIVNSYDCQILKVGSCDIKVENLKPNKYTAFFVDKTEKFFSQIYEFKVAGESADNSLIPSESAQMETPFGGGTINGIAPIIINRVLSKNDSIETTPCVFEISKDGKIITSTEAKIDSNRTCRTILSSNQIPDGDGVYNIKLKNSNLEKPISFIKPANNMMQVEIVTLSPKKGQDLEVKIQNIVDTKQSSSLPSMLSVSSSSSVVSGSSSLTSSSSTSNSSTSNSSSQSSLSQTEILEQNVNFYIYNQSNGKMEEISNVSGNRILVKDGQVKAIIPGKHFENSGNYSIYARLEDGRSTNFTNLSFNNADVGFSDTGIMVDNYSKLSVDNEVKFKLLQIKNKAEEVINEGSCSANIYYSSGGINPTNIDGQIQKGNCEVVLSRGKITQSGPILVSFAGTDSNNSINQSRSFYLQPGNPNNFGELNLEFEPARKDFANNLIVGPVTDRFGNLANTFNQKIFIFDEQNKVIKQFDGINIEQGYAKVLLPSTIFANKKISIQLTDNDNKEILKRDLDIKQTDEKLILPNIPTNLKSDENLNLGIGGFGDAEITSCIFKLIKNSKEFSEQEVKYDKDKDKCETNWEINKFRNQEQITVQTLVGNYKFTNLIKLENSEPANIFVIKPKVKFNKQNELEVSLVTSPILDKQGLTVKQGEIKWQYNGKISKSPIKNGFASLQILAKDLENRDISTNLDQKFLDLDLNVEASPVSINKTNNLKIYLGNHDIANQIENFKIVQGSNFVNSAYPKILTFEAESCNGLIISNNKIKTAKTHFQNKKCYVEVTGDLGYNNLLFEEKGFTIGEFPFVVSEETEEVNWCKGEEDDLCSYIQVVSQISSKIEVTIFDEDKEYNFTNQNLENTVKIAQNGLNPLKEYLVEVSYQNGKNERVKHFKKILGEKIPKGTSN
jgi:hypothetical protein